MVVHKIFFVRHAESLENTGTHSIGRVYHRISSMKLPSSSDVRKSADFVASLFSSNFENPPLTENGLNQIQEVKAKIGKHWLSSIKPHSILVSPLDRARLTCSGLFFNDDSASIPELSDEHLDDDDGSIMKIRSFVRGDHMISTLDLLRERTRSEAILPSKHVRTRCDDFEEWLVEYLKPIKKSENIVIVGHSHFFKTLLKVPYKFKNCDIWSCDFDICAWSSSSKVASARDERIFPVPAAHRWSNLEFIFGLDFCTTTMGSYERNPYNVHGIVKEDEIGY